MADEPQFGQALPPDTVGLLEGLTSTRAIRRFRPDPIPDEDLAAMLFAATRAPSGSNRQPFRFLVLPFHRCRPWHWPAPAGGRFPAVLLAVARGRFWQCSR